MMMYNHYEELKTILNTNQSRSVILSGNIYDLYVCRVGEKNQYVPLIQFICKRAQVANIIQIVYELNGPIRFQDEKHRIEVKNSWIAWKQGIRSVDDLLISEMTAPKISDLGDQFESHMIDSIGNPTVALEFLRQLTICSRDQLQPNKKSLLIIIEAADMMLPVGRDLASLSDKQLHRISIVQDWFSEPAFIEGKDSVVLIAESASQVHPRVSQLPQVINVKVDAPNCAAREHYIRYYCEDKQVFSPDDSRAIHGVYYKPWTIEDLAQATAGLSLYALRQLLARAINTNSVLSIEEINQKVEAYIKSQVGDDVVDFLKPKHTLDDVVGYTQLKKFLRTELIPFFKKGALTGCVVGGPIGAGKTFIFEAVARELNVAVLVLKNLRSQYFGQTDVIFERLKRILEGLDKVCIFVDEADTQFGGVDEGTHDTERRLTGKIQSMMSDSKLKGRVFWILMTARINQLSPDIRREGRAGDLIIPVLDPVGEDRFSFLKWAIGNIDDKELIEIDRLLPKEYSAAQFASLRSYLKNMDSPLEYSKIKEIILDRLSSDIGDTRRQQKLQALINCTRKCLIPDEEIQLNDMKITRRNWKAELRMLLEEIGK